MKSILKNQKLIIILVFLIIIIGFVAVFYWQEKGSSDLETAKAKCLEEFGEMTYEQLVERVNSLPFVEERGPDDDVELQIKIIEINLETIGYLDCSLHCEIKDYYKNVHAKLYDSAYNLIDSLKVPEEIKKAAINENFRTKEAADASRGSLGVEIALKPVEELCLDDGSPKSSFLDSCLKRVEAIGKIEHNCYDICDLIIKYEVNPSQFKIDLTEFDWLLDEPELFRHQAESRMALAFRVGGKDLALKIWDSIPNLETKKQTEKYVESLEYINCSSVGFDQTKECQRKSYEVCLPYYEAVKESICQIEAEKFLD
jgi:hypothetical protein